MTHGRHCVLDGRLMLQSAAHLSTADLGFLAGDGTFTTIRVRAGVALFLDAHLDRLWSACAALEIAPPFPRSELREQVQRLIAAEPNAARSGRMRLTLSRGPGSPPATPSGQPTSLVTIEPWQAQPEIAAGVGIECSRYRRAPHPLHAIKSTSWAANAWLRREATREDTFDVVQMNVHEHVVEGSFNNVFVVDGAGTLWTPAIADGCLAGITRGIVIEEARGTGVAVREGAVLTEMLRSAQEVFLTSSLHGIVAVRSVDGAWLRAPSPGPITATLAARYTARVAAECHDGSARVV